VGRYWAWDLKETAATAANLTKAAGGVLGGAQVVFGAVFNILTVVVLTIYFMAAFDWLRLGAYKLVRPRVGRGCRRSATRSWPMSAPTWPAP
jgi:hypothetical protein